MSVSVHHLSINSLQCLLKYTLTIKDLQIFPPSSFYKKLNHVGKVTLATLVLSINLWPFTKPCILNISTPHFLLQKLVGFS